MKKIIFLLLMPFMALAQVPLPKSTTTFSNINATGNLTVTGTAKVTGASTLTGAVTTGTNLTVGGNLSVTGTSTLAAITTATNSVVGGELKVPSGKYIIAAIGDSRLANSVQDQGSSPFSINWSNQGVLTWFNYLTNQKYYLPYTYDLAVSGYSVSQVLATVPSVLALSPRPDYCIIMAGTNSIAGGVSFASIKADFISIATQLIQGGVIPVFIIDAPRTVASWTSDNNKVHHELNNWLRVWCQQNGYALSDQEYILTSQTTGEPLYNVSDGIHQNCIGAYYEGNALASVFNSINPAFKDVRQQSVYDVYDATYNVYGNVLSAGLMQGTGGTNTGTGASGTVATGWNNRVVSGTCTSVASKENPRSDGLMGDKQILTITTTSTSLVRLAPTSISTGTATYQAGDVIYVEADIDVTSSSLLDFVSLIVIDLNGASATLGTSAGFKGAASTAYPMPTFSISGRVATIPFTISATTATLAIRIEIQVESGGSAVVKVGNVTVRKVI